MEECYKLLKEREAEGLTKRPPDDAPNVSMPPPKEEPPKVKQVVKELHPEIKE